MSAMISRLFDETMLNTISLPGRQENQSDLLEQEVYTENCEKSGSGGTLRLHDVHETHGPHELLVQILEEGHSVVEITLRKDSAYSSKVLHGRGWVCFMMFDLAFAGSMSGPLQHC